MGRGKLKGDGNKEERKNESGRKKGNLEIRGKGNRKKRGRQ